MVYVWRGRFGRLLFFIGDGMDLLIEKYGIYGLILYFVLKEVWPFFRDKFFPEKMKAANEQEARLVLAIENVGVAMKSMSEAIIVQNERLTHLSNQQEEHIRVSNEAVMAMMIKTKTMPRKRKIV